MLSRCLAPFKMLESTLKAVEPLPVQATTCRASLVGELKGTEMKIRNTQGLQTGGGSVECSKHSVYGEAPLMLSRDKDELQQTN